MVGLPYVTLTEYHLVNPYHHHNFNEFSFDFFDLNKLKGSAAETNTLLFKKIFHRFHYVGIFNILPPPIRSICRRHLLNVVRKIDFGLIAIKEKNTKIPTYDKKMLLYEFQECLRSRIPYKITEPNHHKGVIHRIIRKIGSWWLGNN